MASRNAVTVHSVPVIVTGFEPFGGAATNPSGMIALRMNGMCCGSAVVRGILLPVSAPSAWSLLRRTIRTTGARIVIALGVAADRREICVETTARNLSDYRIPDNRGLQPRMKPVSRRSPAHLTALTDPGSLAESMRAPGLPVRLSDDAGLYVCNDLYFRLLRYARDPRTALTAAVFIHVPSEVTLSPAEIQKGIEAAVRHLAPAIT